MYVKTGSRVDIQGKCGEEFDALPPAVYALRFDGVNKVFYLSEQNPITMGKVYGSGLTERTNKIISTFNDRVNKNTGVLLSGNKGSGKTLLTKSVISELLKDDVPVVIIDENWKDFGGVFLSFINSIQDKCVILFDEFEKVYAKKEDQEIVLTLMDGHGTLNKLFMLTSNSTQISDFLLNRPSRIFYHYTYDKIDRETVASYINDNLHNKSHTENIMKLWEISTDISFDVLQSLVEDLNRYPSMSFSTIIRDMNVVIAGDNKLSYDVVSVKLNGKTQRIDEEEVEFSLHSFMTQGTPIWLEVIQVTRDDYEKFKQVPCLNASCYSWDNPESYDNGCALAFGTEDAIDLDVEDGSTTKQSKPTRAETRNIYIKLRYNEKYCKVTDDSVLMNFDNGKLSFSAILNVQHENDVVETLFGK